MYQTLGVHRILMTWQVDGATKVYAPKTLHFDGQHGTDFRKEGSDTVSRITIRITVLKGGRVWCELPMLTDIKLIHKSLGT